MRLGETPVPIPNTTVKTQTADGTMLETAWESRWLPNSGGIAQLGEHLPCKQGVTSSNLVISTLIMKRVEWREKKFNFLNRLRIREIEFLFSVGYSKNIRDEHRRCESRGQ